MMLTTIESDALARFVRAGSMIEGVQVRALDMHEDERGSFTEFFRAEWDSGIEPTQWSFVRSKPGVFRGMHLHRRHEEYVLVVDGRMSIGLYDMRPGSPTEGTSMLLELSGDELAFVSWPPGIVHGWYAHETTLHVQAVSETYDEYKDDDNLGCRGTDPELGIPWPETPRLIAPRAQGFGSLRELVERTLRIDPGFRYPL